MPNKELFDRIKKVCDERRLVAMASGKAAVATLTENGVNYVFTIGFNAMVNREVVFIGNFDKRGMEIVAVSMPDDRVRRLHRQQIKPDDLFPDKLEVDFGFWGYREIDYALVNKKLDGLVDAIYPSGTTLIQLAVCDSAGKLPWEKGYEDSKQQQVRV